MAKKRFYNEKAKSDMNGLMGRERMDRADFEMISEDHSAVANLPQNAIYKPWPKPSYYADFDLDNNIRGIDNQIDADGRQMKKHKSTKKY